MDEACHVSQPIGQQEEHSEDRSDSVDRVEKQKCDGYRNAEENDDEVQDLDLAAPLPTVLGVSRCLVEVRLAKVLMKEVPAASDIA